MGRVAQLVQRLATGWTVRGSNPVWGVIFRTSPERSWGPPSRLYKGCRVFPGSKERSGRDADSSPPSSTVVLKGQSYTSTPPMGRTACTERRACTRVHFTFYNYYRIRVTQQCGYHVFIIHIVTTLCFGQLILPSSGSRKKIYKYKNIILFL